MVCCNSRCGWGGGPAAALQGGLTVCPLRPGEMGQDTEKRPLLAPGASVLQPGSATP